MSPATGPKHASLRISSITVPVHLGWGSQERAAPQQVMIDLELRFRIPPTGCASDQLSDTVDYAKLVHRVTHLASGQVYRLIEHLAQVLADGVRADLPEGTQLALTVTKRPPIPEVEGGATFRISDWPAGSSA